MKRKYDEGYALPFALVVLLFLCIVAMVIMDLTYKDLKAQQDSITRMENQYEAQGKIEQIVGKLENNTGTKTLTELFGMTPETEGVVGETTAITATMHINSDVDETDSYMVTIECTVRLTAKPGGSFALEADGYALTGPCSVEYLSYKVLSEEIPRQNEGGGGG